MSKLSITLANRLIPNRLKLNCNGLEVDFDNCSFTHNSVILKRGAGNSHSSFSPIHMPSMLLLHPQSELLHISQG